MGVNLLCHYDWWYNHAFMLQSSAFCTVFASCSCALYYIEMYDCATNLIYYWSKCRFWDYQSLTLVHFGSLHLCIFSLWIFQAYAFSVLTFDNSVHCNVQVYAFISSMQSLVLCILQFNASAILFLYISSDIRIYLV